MNFFKTIASTNNSSQENPYSWIIMFIIFGLIFYFMILRPQQKRIKEQKRLINSITKGDEVLTTGGLIGRVVKITGNDYITIMLNDTNEVIIKKDFVTSILPNGTLKKL